MIAILNIAACGGASSKKWEKIKLKLFPKNDFRIIRIMCNEIFSDIIKSALKRGEANFIAAGGDGTINNLLNLLIDSTDASQIDNLTIGAIGLGSSNDFHKPFNNIIDGIPYAINFNDTQMRDVGYIDFFKNGETCRKHFLINASL